MGKMQYYMSKTPSGKFQFAIDRGGTFTDVFARCPSGKIVVHKLLSEYPSHYNDAPTEGIRRILQQNNNSSSLRSTNELMRRIELLQLKRQLEVLATFVPNEILNYRLEKQQRSFVGVLLFADVSGFTPLTEKYNKTGKGGIYRLTATLNAYIGAIVEVIHLFGGDILKFSGDAFLALWKVKQGKSAYDILHVVVVCALVIQKNLGVFDTEVNVLLKVKLAISCGNVTFAVIGSGVTKNYVIVGQAIFDVKDAEHVSVSGDVVISPAAWSHMLHDRYVTTNAENGNVKVWKTVYRKNEEQKRIYFEEKTAEVLEQVAKHLNHRKKVHVKKTFESNSTMSKIIEMFLKSLPKREQIKKVPKYWSVDELRPFIIKPVQEQVDESQPVEYLTEMREVTIQFINIVPVSREPDYLIEMCNSSYKIICRIVGESLGVVNKISLFDKDFMILVLFGLRGIRHEMESQHALRTAYNIRKMITLNVLNVESCSIGITQGLVYCGVVGHPFRREYTVIGTEVNKAARMMCAYPFKVICDYKTFKHSQLASFYFRQQNLIKLKGIEDAGSIYEYNEDFDDYEDNRKQKLIIFGRAKEYNMIRSIAFKEDNYLKNYNGICFFGPRKIGKTSILLQSVRAIRKNGEAPMVISMELNSHSYVPFSTVLKLYDKLFDKLGTLKDNITLMPHLPRQLFKVDLDIWFPQDDVATFKYKILNTFRNIVEVNNCGTIIFIDNIEHVDFQSWEILQIVFDEGLIQLFTTSCLDEAEWNLQEHLAQMKTLFLHEVTPIASKYVAGLACMFLDAVGIPNHLEYLLINSCGGRPGYIQSSILRLINNGSLQLKLINKSEKDYLRFIFPEEVNNVQGDIVAIVEFSDRYRHIGQELTLQAISMDLFDSFTPYQQLVIKTASVIGDMFSRSLLVVAMQYPPEEQLAKVVMQLFEEEVFECGAKFINSEDLDSAAYSKFCCRCHFSRTTFLDTSKDLPRYAYCKILHFKNRSIREVAYDLLPGNQKKELHLLCTEVLETSKHSCPTCRKQPILYIMYICTYKIIMEFCLDAKKIYKSWLLPEPDHGDMKKIIRKSMFGIRAESFKNDTVVRPHRDARRCSCFEIWLTIYKKLKYHAEQGKHTGKLVYYTMKYAYILLLIRDYQNAIRYFRETVELCLVDANEAKQDVVMTRFKTFVMGRSQIGLTQAHLALGQLHVAKNHLILALRQYNIPSLALEYRTFNELFKRTFLVNLKQMYLTAHGNTIFHFDCGNALAFCARIFTLEGKWSMAKIAAINSLHCLKSVNPNVSLLYEVYCNIIELYSYADQRHRLEKLQKYVFQEVTYNFGSADMDHINATVTLLETLLESHYTCGQIVEGIRIGYRLLDICTRTDFFTFDSRLFFHLPLLLIYNGRIRDAGDVMRIYRRRMDTNISSMPIYYIITFIIYLTTGFVIEKVDAIINFASQLKSIQGKPKRLFEFLFTLVQLHYFRLGKFFKSEEWKGDNIWNPKEVKSSIPMCEMVFILQCKILQYVHSYHQKNATADVEAKRINKLILLLGDSCKQYTIYLPMYYYLKAWLLRVSGHKAKSKKFIKRMRKESAKSKNVLMQCQAMASLNLWNGGYSIKYERRPLVSFLEADSYSLKQLTSFLHADPIE